MIVALLIYYCLSNLSLIFQWIRYILGVLSPVIYGLVIAYLLNPLMKFYQRGLERLFNRGKGKTLLRFANGVSIVLALISGILIISVLLWMIVPQVISSVGTLVNTLPDQAENYYHKVRKWIEQNPYFANQFREAILKLTGSLDEWIQNDLFPWLQSKVLPNVNSLAATFASGLFNVLGVLYNLLIGCIVAVYLLSGKEKFIAQAKKLTYAVFGKKQADVILHYSSLTNDTFSGFISGKIVDSTIVGVICFAAMCIFRLPYALLVSVIVGVTNVIPVFGPYIGAIPSAFLILLVSPIQCLYFVILIVILQQLDGNVIGPAILGESTGLSAFWVLFAILLFGGMWGIVGMLVGVPLFAVIYRLVKDYLELRLHHKGLETETAMYQGLQGSAGDKVTLMELLEPETVVEQETEEQEMKETQKTEEVTPSETGTTEDI
jgi:predicted PurR-regulated permease PerM